ncbi:MAG: porphobilinogen synthase [Hyphomicrobiales bacterium]|nr:porphobilinogen synthase [Hyphomicrobiales bacterium]
MGSFLSYGGRFPQTRLRRLRQTPWVRALTREHRLSASDLIWPIFLQEGASRPRAIASMPGVQRLSIADAVKAGGEALELGIPVLALFPHVPPHKKTEDGREALNPENLVCRAVRALKRAHPTLGILCDVALDPYTSHGHDGLVRDGEILNDATLEVLAQQAVVQADAGCDIIAPSDMMDGRIGACRRALDGAGASRTMLMAYSAKYASALYGPFRDAVGSKGRLKGDKRSYQMDPANSDEALRELAQDVDEGADMLMVKPGGFYLDIVRRASEHFPLPVFAYQVSGEYAMLRSAARHGMEGDAVIMESLLAFKRAGASGILTYFARDAARLLRRQSAQ